MTPAPAAPAVYYLDANVFIQASQYYYSFSLCPNYWDVLKNLGKEGLIVIPREILNELTAKDDALSIWLKDCNIQVIETDAEVIANLKRIMGHDPKHKLLADNSKGRSIADPWLIAHAMAKGGVVVSKEVRTTRPIKKKIRIPDVCDNMGIRCITDFEFLEEIGVTFTANQG